LKNNKTFCILPWINISTRANGDLRVCCHANQGPTRGIYKKENGDNYNLHQDKITDAINSPLAKDIRKTMLEGKWHKECIRCLREETAGMKSRRINDGERFAEHITLEKAEKHTDADGTIDLEHIKQTYYDIRLGNFCNLKCRMCSPMDSSAWYGDYVKMWKTNKFKDTHGVVEMYKNKKNKFVADDYDWVMKDHFWDNLRENVSGMQHVYLVGGEPLIIEEHYDFLNYCVEEGYAKNITLEYNTNLTNIQPRALELWKNFKQVQFGISMDGIGKTLEYVRNPLKSKLMERNLKKLDEAGLEGLNFRAWIAFTIGALNAFHFPELLKWKIEQDFGIISPLIKNNPKPFVNAHPIHRPFELSIRFLPKEVKDKVRDHWEAFRIEFAEEIVHTIDFDSLIKKNPNFLGKMKPANKEWAIDKMNQLLDTNLKFMYDEDLFTEENNKKFWEYNGKLDDIRGESMQDSLPELYEAMKKFKP
jgi:MoaA/NifB/PqqE/SkfB family radical SAM enzyme